ncbi:MAG: thioredoxin family protein [Opitutae bacterium]|nr:thioredoxin family protein [Opitutae bacterium]
MHLRRLLALFLVTLLGLSAVAQAAGPVRNGNVVAELVAAQAGIQPGQPFWIALKMNHDEHWHSYWINPGTGYATSLKWKLPEGFKAGDIVWPTPHVVQDTSGKITGYGYVDESLLFVQITPPANLAPGSNVTLSAAAEWLMCKDVCMPGEAQIELVLPVTTQPHDSANAALFSKYFSALPQPLAGWTATAERGAKSVTLRVTPSGAASHRPADLHFFDLDGLLDYAAPQKIREENGGFVIEMALSADAKPDVNHLAGVLASGNGWAPGSGYAGATLDVPLAAAKVAAVAGTTTAAAPAAPAATSLLGTLALAFVGGLILNLMPCVFPVLGIKIMGFVNQSGNDKSIVVKHGVVFALGVLISFWTLAGVLLALRAGGAQLGWGFQLQSSAFVFGMAAFLLIFALNMSGLFEVGLAATGAGANLQMKEGFSGSFFTGALATLVATPCSAPFLAPALGAALTLSPLESLLVFTTIAVGLSMPYLLLSIFPQAIKMLPRPGAWMETFKQLMAFPLYATVGWLLWVLAGQTAGDDYALLMILFGFVLVAMAAWVYGRFGQAHGKPGRQRFGYIAAAALFAAGLYTGWPKDAQAATNANGTAAYQVAWEKWSPEAIAAAQKAGHFVYVDFTARWCATCQTNKAAIFHNDAVLTELAKRNVVLLRGDWTNKDPLITAELARWHRSAVPFNLIYAPGKADPVQLPELLTPDRVLAGFAEAAK